MGTVPLLSPALSPHSFPTTSQSGPFSFTPESYSLSFSPFVESHDFAFNQTLKAHSIAQQHHGSFAPQHNGGLMIEDVKARPRNMSMSSGTDREQSVEAKPRRKGSSADGENNRSSNPRKRSLPADTIDYPRRRATIAVFLSRLFCDFNFLKS
jgi:hypothetical protein